MSKAPADRLLPQLLATRSIECGDRTCVVDLSAGVTTTYAELHRGSLAWAAGLASLGATQGTTVATLLNSGATPLAIWVGLGWLGAIDVPLNGEYEGEMLANVLSDAEVEVAVVEPQWLSAVLSVSELCPQLRAVVVLGADAASFASAPISVVASETLLDAAPALGELEGPQPHEIACMVYTSGTTGRSKGVLIPWQQCHESAIWSVPSELLDAGSVAYMPFPCHHMSFLAPAYSMFMLGGSIVTRHRFSVSSYWQDVGEHACVYGPLLGSMAHLLAAQPERPDDSDNPMRYGAMVPVIPDLDAYEKRFGVQIGTVFGMTELSIPIRSDGWRVKYVDGEASCGRLRPGVSARVVDANDWPVEPGEVGELVLRYDDPWAMAVGYWRNPEATAEAWRNAWFHTGDAVVMNANGDFFYRDRIKDVIRRRGENISSAEVEALLASHPGIAEVAAVAVASPLGEDDVKVVVVAARGHRITPDEVWAHAEATMPRFMRPRYIEIVEELPKTPTLKVKKSALRAAAVTELTWDRDQAAARGTR